MLILNFKKNHNSVRVIVVKKQGHKVIRVKLKFGECTDIFSWLGATIAQGK